MTGSSIPEVYIKMHAGVFFKWFGFSKSIHHDGQLEVKKGSFNLMHGYPSKLSKGLAAYHLFC